MMINSWTYLKEMWARLEDLCQQPIIVHTEYCSTIWSLNENFAVVDYESHEFSAITSELFTAIWIDESKLRIMRF